MESSAGTSGEFRTLFAEVLLPVSVPGTFTYRVPADRADSIQPLLRVLVPFGSRRLLTGIVVELHETPPTAHEAKMLLDVLDASPLFVPQQVKLFQWMAEYYMCSAGEVLQAAMPSGLKLSTESIIQLHPEFDPDRTETPFSEREQRVLDRLRSGTLTYAELTSLLGVRNPHQIIKSLRQKEAIIILEEIREKYQPKTERRLKFSDEYCGRPKLEELFVRLAAKPKQEEIILEILRALPVMNEPSSNATGVTRASLIHAGHSESAIATLVKNGILVAFERIVSRFPEITGPAGETPVLSAHQEEARQNILQGFAESKPVLLAGVTGSGKTEVYIHLIRSVIESGGQALFLLPEIALTTQIVQRLRQVFGNELGIYHSRFSDNERVETWNNIVTGKTRVVVGVRSSIFLPFENLGLVVVDEEHDGSYKQDRTPRYQARDTALMLARLHHAKVLLGSGTPSAESLFHVSRGNFGFAELKERYGLSSLPSITLVNLREERKLKRMRGCFSPVMTEAIEEALGRDEQIILFQNRRGYSPSLECLECGHISTCIHCSVSLTYHQFRQALICHYCGYREALPKACPACKSTQLVSDGPGTERIEEEVRLYFPDVTVQRMDLDTTRSKNGHENILDDFASGRTRILVGTQMVTKGLDFGNVGLVGVFDTDRMLYFPDFRSHERAFQLLVQVSGRSGRREKQGRVVVQTFQPQLPLFDRLVKHEVLPFMEEQLADRSSNQYPPFTRLIGVHFRHAEKRISYEGAAFFADQARIALKDLLVLGPAEPGIGKVRNEYIHHVLIKISRDHANLSAVKQRLRRILTVMMGERKFAKVKVVFDVDPWSL